MASSNDPRQKSTTIYILLSVVTLVAGIALTIWGGRDIPEPRNAKGQAERSIQFSPIGFAVGTSLLAAGLASLGFAVIRKYDDQDQSELSRKLDRIEVTLKESKSSLKRARVVIPDASERCLFDPQISDRFREAVQDTSPSAPLEVDVIGLKLFRFLKDQFEHLRIVSEQRDVRVRMLLQDPDSDVFSAICELETRDENGTKNDILSTLKFLTGATLKEDQLTYTLGNLTILVRFFAQFQPIAFFRVNETVLVRPRIRSGSAGSRFYETYLKGEGASYFGLYRDHFDDCWSGGKFKIPPTLARKLENVFQIN